MAADGVGKYHSHTPAKNIILFGLQVSRMSTPDDMTYNVVVNDEGQFSFVLEGKTDAPGW